MCRYAFSGPYKRHFACFECRKAFKQPSIDDWLAVRGRGHVYKELAHLWAYQRGLERREQELGVRLADLQAEYRDAARKCPDCGQPMIDMGLDFKPPRQTDVKAWRTLHGMYRVGHEFFTCGCNGPGFIPISTAEYRQYLRDRRKQYEWQMNHARDSLELSSDRKREAGEYWTKRIAAIDAELTVLP